MTTQNLDPQRVERYTERCFQRHGCTEFPTVRQAARALGALYRIRSCMQQGMSGEVYITDKPAKGAS